MLITEVFEKNLGIFRCIIVTLPLDEPNDFRRVCPSLLLSISTYQRCSPPQIFPWNFTLWTSMQICREKSIFGWNRKQKARTLYTATYIRLIVVGDIKSPESAILDWNSFRLLCIRPFGLSVGKYQRGSHWTNLREIWYRGLSWKHVQEFQIWLQAGNNIGNLTWRPR